MGLTIAGSDPTGGAGVQADLQVFWHLGLQGISTVTAVTAQSKLGVRSFGIVAPELVAQQLGCLVAEHEIAVVKTGMLARDAIVRAVADVVSRNRWPLVVDPVMRARDGHLLLSVKGGQRLIEELFPRATVVTPNLSEAGLILNRKVATLDDMKAAAQDIHRLGPKYVLITGGHLDGPAIDVLYDGRRFDLFEGPRLPGDRHGTGCLLSAAIAGHLGHGQSIAQAVRKAKELVASAISQSATLGYRLPLPMAADIP